MGRDDDWPAAAVCVIRAERQAPGLYMFTVSIVRDVSAGVPPSETRTVVARDVVRLVHTFLGEASGDAGSEVDRRRGARE